MNDIENKIRSKIERFGNRSMMFTRTEVTELLTTIESQKEEIEKLIAERTENESIIKRKLAIKQAAVDEAMTTVESLKAITELAVKGLKDVSDVDTSSYSNDSWSMRDIANAAISKIEKLQNE